MKKIQTIFERDWEWNRKVINKFVDGVFPGLLSGMIATEKLDWTNVRITIRNHTVVRVEKRRNPDKIQKAKGISEPWYTDASEFWPEDKWIFDGLNNTDISEVPDGEWSGELLWPNVQGNLLNLETNRVVFFSLLKVPVFEDCPSTYEELKEWLPKQKSKYGNDCGIEWIVWHRDIFWNDEMYKIKTKDF